MQFLQFFLACTGIVPVAVADERAGGKEGCLPERGLAVVLGYDMRLKSRFDVFSRHRTGVEA